MGGSFLPHFFEDNIMKISIEDTAAILNLTEEEVLLHSQRTEIFSAHFKPPTDMTYNEDGTVVFHENGSEESSWEFEMSEVLLYKKKLEMEEEGFEV